MSEQFRVITPIACFYLFPFKVGSEAGVEVERPEEAAEAVRAEAGVEEALEGSGTGTERPGEGGVCWTGRASENGTLRRRRRRRGDV